MGAKWPAMPLPVPVWDTPLPFPGYPLPSPWPGTPPPRAAIAAASGAGERGRLLGPVRSRPARAHHDAAPRRARNWSRPTPYGSAICPGGEVCSTPSPEMLSDLGLGLTLGGPGPRRGQRRVPAAPLLLLHPGRGPRTRAVRRDGSGPRGPHVTAGVQRPLPRGRRLCPSDGRQPPAACRARPRRRHDHHRQPAHRAHRPEPALLGLPELTMLPVLTDLAVRPGRACRTRPDPPNLSAPAGPPAVRSRPPRPHRRRSAPGRTRTAPPPPPRRQARSA